MYRCYRCGDKYYKEELVGRYCAKCAESRIKDILSGILDCSYPSELGDIAIELMDILKEPEDENN